WLSGVAAREHARHRRLLHRIGLVVRSKRPHFEFTPELLGERATQASARYQKEAVKCNRTLILKMHVNHLRTATVTDDALGLDGDPAHFQIRQLLGARHDRAIEEEGQLSRCGPFGHQYGKVCGSRG